MTYDDVEILTDQEVKGIYNDVYNSFWLRYYHRVPIPQSEEWEQIVEQEKGLRKKYRNCPLVVHQIQNLMDQLEARSRKGAGK